MPGEKLGASGQFPDGKLGEHDEGEIRFAIGEVGDLVGIDFGTPVRSMAMQPEQAVAMAKLLIAKARIVARRRGVPLVVELHL